MSNYNKNCVRILNKIDNKDNKLIIYTEFDTKYEIGEILYISIVDNININSLIDSLSNKKGYELLGINGNKLIIDFPHNILIDNGITNLPYNKCFIGKVYVNNSTINKATINNTILKEINIDSINKSDINSIQTIILSVKEVGSQREINNIDFYNKYNNNDKILKSEYDNISDKINSYYTYNNNGYGISIINLSNDDIVLTNSNIDSGYFKNCILEGVDNYINNGYFDSSYIDDYEINNGYFYNCTLNLNNVWNYGYWYDNLSTGTTNINFQITDWLDGIWENGIFPNYCTWHNGTFVDGNFNGYVWKYGEFHGGIFNNTTWENGNFNGGKISNSTWINGVFYDGEMSDTTWYNGTLYDGIIYSTDESNMYHWKDGTIKNGTLLYIHWENGTVDNGDFYRCEWDNGTFNNGQMLECNWVKGNFYDGIIQGGNDNTWKNGIFFNGTMIDINWEKGIVYNGIFYDVLWDSGTWYNGIAFDTKFKKVDWYNGIFNSTLNEYKLIDSETDYSYANGIISGGTWYNGVFNNGLFGVDNDITTIWQKGNFYNGIYNGNIWNGGLFYKGIITLNKFIPDRYKVNQKYKAYNIDVFNIDIKNNTKRKVKMNLLRKSSKYITPRTKTPSVPPNLR